MAEETRYYGGGTHPRKESGAPGAALAETEIAATVATPATPGRSAPIVAPAAQVAVAVELSPGSEVGEYRVVRKLGEGGMGAVYAGVHPAIGKRVAIKVLAPHCAADVDLVRRFLDEARAVNLIHHRHIIDIFSFGELPGRRPYFVMEYLDGESLADAIDGEHLMPAELRPLLAQICSALHATHQVEVVHRDLKPENIWIARPTHGEPYVKLLDFGIAKLVDPTRTNLTQTGAVMGTPLFMSPEQCMGRLVDARTDIYALGVLLYRIFVGRYPFTGTVTTELALKHVIEPPPRPSAFQPLPQLLEQLILDCLAKEPNARPASAEILAARLDSALAAWPEHHMARPATEDPRPAVTSSSAREVPSLREEKTSPVAPVRQRGNAILIVAALTLAGGLALALWLWPASTSAPQRTPIAAPATPGAPAPPPTPAPAAPSHAPSATAVNALEATASVQASLPTEGRPRARESGRARMPQARPLPSAPAPGPTAEPTIAPPPPVLAKPGEAVPPVPRTLRPTRAQERGLLDENPLR